MLLVASKKAGNFFEIFVDFSDLNFIFFFFAIREEPKSTVVCKIVHKFASVWCKTTLGEVGVSLL